MELETCQATELEAALESVTEPQEFRTAFQDQELPPAKPPPTEACPVQEFNLQLEEAPAADTNLTSANMPREETDPIHS
jgi:hypothetical protein